MTQPACGLFAAPIHLRNVEHGQYHQKTDEGQAHALRVDADREQ